MLLFYFVSLDLWKNNYGFHLFWYFPGLRKTSKFHPISWCGDFTKTDRFRRRNQVKLWFFMQWSVSCSSSCQILRNIDLNGNIVSVEFVNTGHLMRNKKSLRDNFSTLYKKWICTSVIPRSKKPHVRLLNIYFNWIDKF